MDDSTPHKDKTDPTPKIEVSFPPDNSPLQTAGHAIESKDTPDSNTQERRDKKKINWQAWI